MSFDFVPVVVHGAVPYRAALKLEALLHLQPGNPGDLRMEVAALGGQTYGLRDGLPVEAEGRRWTIVGSPEPTGRRSIVVRLTPRGEPA